MAEIPNVTFHAFSDQPHTVFVHLGGKVRRFEATEAEQIRDLIKKVMIAEFGLPQDEAEVAADAAMEKRDEPEKQAAHLDLLQEQLTECQKEGGELLERALSAEGELSVVKDQLADARSEVEGLKASLAKVSPDDVKSNSRAPNGGETVTGASAGVGTKPEDEKSPAQRTDAPPAPGGGGSRPEEEMPPAETEPPRTETGPSPNQEGAGGDGGHGG